MRHTPAVFGEHGGIGVQGPFDHAGGGAAVPVPVGVVGPGDGCHRADEVQLAGVMSSVKLGDDGMILIAVGLGAAHGGVIGRHQRAVQPFVRMQQDRQHAGGIQPVEHRLVQLRRPLAGEDLPHVGHPRQPLTARRCGTDGLEGLALFGRASGRGLRQIHGGLESGHPFRSLGHVVVPVRRRVGDHDQMAQLRVPRSFRRRSRHLQDPADGTSGPADGLRVEDRHRHSREDVGGAHARGQRGSEDAGEVGTGPGRLGPGLDDVEHRSRPAGLTRSDHLEGDAVQRLVVEQKPAKLIRVDVERGAIESGRSAETKFPHRVVRQCQIHAVTSILQSRPHDFTFRRQWQSDNAAGEAPQALSKRQRPGPRRGRLMDRRVRCRRSRPGRCHTPPRGPRSP